MIQESKLFRDSGRVFKNSGWGDYALRMPQLRV